MANGSEKLENIGQRLAWIKKKFKEKEQKGPFESYCDFPKTLYFR